VSTKKSVTIRIRGQDFHIRTDDDEAALQRVARYLDETMSMVERKTGTVDSLQLALLSALNLARELVELRDAGSPRPASPSVDFRRLASLTELAESALDANAIGH
jgi:cell division protein ZapA (FtsZ GTPase activity inhibitor)